MNNPQAKELLTRNRSLRERIRDSTSNIIPSFSTVSDAFSSSSKSRSVDQSLLTSSTSGSPPRHLLSSHPVSSHPLLPSVVAVPPPPSHPITAHPKSSSSTVSSNSSPIHQQSAGQGQASHTVTPSDTLTSLAARYDCTPSELIKLNRLNTRLVFPGQILKVPSKSQQTDNVFEEDSDTQNQHRILLQQRKFIKINVRHITDGNGVVSGTLLVTPNAVMFDPNVSDPLVIDQGAETYGVILPLDVIVHAGIYSDIAQMKVYGKYGAFVPPGPKPFLYPNTAATSTLHESAPTGSGGISGGSGGSPAGGGGPTETTTRKEKVLKRLSFPLTWMESLTAGHTEESVIAEAKSAPPTAGHDKKRDSKSFSVQPGEDEEDDFPMAHLLTNVDKLISRHDSVTNQQSSPPIRTTEGEELTWYLCLTTGRPKDWRGGGPTSRTGLIVSYGQKNHVRPEYWFHIVDNLQVQELYKFWMIWWPHLYSEHVEPQLIASRGYELIDWETMDLDKHEKKQCETAEADAVGELTKESWEMLKSPYTKLSSLLNRSQTLLTSTSSSATNFGQGILDSLSDFASLDYNNEEVVSMSDELRQALYGSSEEFKPELIGYSEILNDQDTHNLARHLTARAEGYPWTLTFTTSQDGFSLSTLYRKMSYIREEETPILLVIEDTNLNVFGALVSTSLRPSDSFYGTGQSFLFNLKPQFRVFKWTGENMLFIKGGLDGIVIGAADGKFGLWLDADLNCGRSDSCGTYGNPPLVEEKDFIIKTLECWAFLTSAASSQQNQQNQQTSLLESNEIVGQEEATNNTNTTTNNNFTNNNSDDVA